MTPERKDFCERCQNTGWIECMCGGDICVCENYGEMECPVCFGEPPHEDDFDEPLPEPTTPKDET